MKRSIVIVAFAAITICPSSSRCVRWRQEQPAKASGQQAGCHHHGPLRTPRACWRRFIVTHPQAHPAARHLTRTAGERGHRPYFLVNHHTTSAIPPATASALPG